MSRSLYDFKCDFDKVFCFNWLVFVTHRTPRGDVMSLVKATTSIQYNTHTDDYVKCDASDCLNPITLVVWLNQRHVGFNGYFFPFRNYGSVFNSFSIQPFLLTQPQVSNVHVVKKQLTLS